MGGCSVAGPISSCVRAVGVGYGPHLSHLVEASRDALHQLQVCVGRGFFKAVVVRLPALGGIAGMCVFEVAVVWEGGYGPHLSQLVEASGDALHQLQVCMREGVRGEVRGWPCPFLSPFPPTLTAVPHLPAPHTLACTSHRLSAQPPLSCSGTMVVTQAVLRAKDTN